MFSYAGRTDTPAAQPLPTRIGGFGGVQGLAAYLREAAITHLVDATHPFAARISANAVAACAATDTPLLALEREPWRAGPGDRWQAVADIGAAVAALPAEPARVFLAIGQQNLPAFAARPEHYYLLRLVDPPTTLPLVNAGVVVARGPFSAGADETLLSEHAISHIVAKNSGGEGARAKLEAARALGLPVILIDRPILAPRPLARSIEAVMHWIAHGANRGV